MKKILKKLLLRRTDINFESWLVYNSSSSIFIVFSRIIKICLLGLALGAFYPLLTIGLYGPSVLVGALGGLLVCIFYSLFELVIFKDAFFKIPLWKQLASRISAYTLIFTTGISVLYLTQGFYNYENTGIAEDEFYEAGQHLFTYILAYSFLFSAITQVFYVLSRVIGFSNLGRLFSGNYIFSKTEKALVAAISFKNVSTADVLFYLADFFEQEQAEIIEAGHDEIVLLWTQEKLAQRSPEAYINIFYKNLQARLQQKKHIWHAGKMPLPVVGANFNNVVLQQFGVSPLSVTKYGPAVSLAKAALQHCLKSDIPFHFAANVAETQAQVSVHLN